MKHSVRNYLMLPIVLLTRGLTFALGSTFVYLSRGCEWLNERCPGLDAKDD